MRGRRVSELLDAALGYAARGWPVFPCAPGSKTPAIRGGRGVLDATTDGAQIRAWWTATPDANIGIATGTPGPDVIDVDVKPDGSGWEAFTDLILTGVISGADGYITTPSGGMHAYYAGSAQRNGSIRKARIDFRGTGGYVLAPPSIVGKPYVLRNVADTLTTAVDWPAIRAVLDPPPDPQPFRQPARDQRGQAPAGQLRPGDDWAAQTAWPEILRPHGWKLARDLGNGRQLWTRPGKERGTSATTRENGGLYVFSSSTGFETEVPYSKFGAMAVLEHGGDHAAAAAALRQAGYGTPLPENITPITIGASHPDQATNENTQSDDTTEPVHSSWHPRDLTPILDGDASGDPLPAFLARTDGRQLLYAGKVNAFIGESESGKTWVALLAITQALHAGQHVLFLDFEDAPAGITGRLLALGATRDQILRQFRYISPDEPLTALAVADLGAVLADPAPDLAVLDGVNAAMTLLGLKLTDNTDATAFSQRLLRPLKKTGAAVLTIDHTTKDKEHRGPYAIGAQAKRADIDGAAYLIEPVQKFGRGQEGKLRLTVSKDRPGHVRAISNGATYAGMVILTPGEDGAITAEITAPDMRPGTEKPEFQPTYLMEAVSRFVESQAEPVTARTIRSAVRGKTQWITIAIGQLVAGGWLTTEDGPRNGQLHRSALPYKPGENDTQNSVVPSGSRLVPSGSRNQSSDHHGEWFPPVPEGGTKYPSEPGTTRGHGHPQNHSQTTPVVPDHETVCTSCGERAHDRRSCPILASTGGTS
jgi:hypothetical protein